MRRYLRALVAPIAALALLSGTVVVVAGLGYEGQVVVCDGPRIVDPGVSGTVPAPKPIHVVNVPEHVHPVSASPDRLDGLGGNRPVLGDLETASFHEEHPPWMNLALRIGRHVGQRFIGDDQLQQPTRHLAWRVAMIPNRYPHAGILLWDGVSIAPPDHALYIQPRREMGHLDVRTLNLSVGGKDLPVHAVGQPGSKRDDESRSERRQTEPHRPPLGRIPTALGCILAWAGLLKLAKLSNRRGISRAVAWCGFVLLACGLLLCWLVPLRATWGWLV